MTSNVRHRQEITNMRDDNKERIDQKTTGRPEHWLYTTPDSHDELTRECERLQRTIKVLIAAGFVGECKADQAYEIARTA